MDTNAMPAVPWYDLQRLRMKGIRDRAGAAALDPVVQDSIIELARTLEQVLVYIKRLEEK